MVVFEHDVLKAGLALVEHTVSGNKDCRVAVLVSGKCPF